LSSSTDKSDKTDSDSDNARILNKTQTHLRSGVILMDNVYIGSNVIIEDDVVIGSNCIVGNNALIKSGTIMEPFSMVGAGSVVAEESLVKSDQVWAGNTSHQIRSLKPQERSNHSENINELVDLGLCHA